MQKYLLQDNLQEFIITKQNVLYYRREKGKAEAV